MSRQAQLSSPDVDDELLKKSVKLVREMKKTANDILRSNPRIKSLKIQQKQECFQENCFRERFRDSIYYKMLFAEPQIKLIVACKQSLSSYYCAIIWLHCPTILSTFSDSNNIFFRDFFSFSHTKKLMSNSFEASIGTYHGYAHMLLGYPSNKQMRQRSVAANELV